MVVANWNRIVFLTLHFFYLAYDWNHHNTHCTNSWIDEVISMWKYVCGIIKPDYCSFTDQIVFWHSTENLFLPIAAIDLKGFFELNKCLYIYMFCCSFLFRQPSLILSWRILTSSVYHNALFLWTWHMSCAACGNDSMHRIARQNLLVMKWTSQRRMRRGMWRLVCSKNTLKRLTQNTKAQNIVMSVFPSTARI